MPRDTGGQLPSGVKLRAGLRAGDLGIVMGLHGRQFLAEFGFGTRFEGYLAEGLGRFAKVYDPDFDCIWVAEDRDGVPVGTVSIVRASEVEAQLRWFVVDASARGMGVGTALLGAALEFARSRGYASIYLWTVEELHAALHLYRKAGFSLTEEKLNSDWAERSVPEQRYDLNLNRPPQ